MYWDSQIMLEFLSFFLFATSVNNYANSCNQHQTLPKQDRNLRHPSGSVRSTFPSSEQPSHHRINFPITCWIFPSSKQSSLCPIDSSRTYPMVRRPHIQLLQVLFLFLSSDSLYMDFLRLSSHIYHGFIHYRGLVISI